MIVHSEKKIEDVRRLISVCLCFYVIIGMLPVTSTARSVKPVPDKYAFQATDKRTSEQTKRRTSSSHKAHVFAAMA